MPGNDPGVSGPHAICVKEMIESAARFHFVTIIIAW